MPSLAAPLTLIVARARRRPGRWVLTALGIALAAAFGGAVAAEGTIAGDQGARSVLAQLSAHERAITVTWQGVVTPTVRRQARVLLADDLGIRQQTEVVSLAPVRLSGLLVRPAAIDPLPRWVATAAGSPPALAPCRAGACPVLLAGGSLPRRTLGAAGMRLEIAGSASLLSAAPLGFIPEPASGQPPVLLTGDPAGLDSLPGLSGVYRTHSWLGLLPTGRLSSWQLAATEERLQRAQAALLAASPQFSFSAPFAALDAARAQASAAPRRLLLAGGGAIAALAVFVVLAAGGLRRDQREDLSRLRTAGARVHQCLILVVGEAALLCAVALLAGAGAALGAAALLAGAAGVPVAGVLAHSLITPVGAAVLAGAWVCATTVVSAVLLASGSRVADVLAVAAVAAVALALTRGADGSGPLPVLLAPLCCVAAGVLTFRVAAVLLRAAERLARRGPVLVRLALVSLARAPGPPALAIAFIAVSIGLGSFALAYRATLLRGTADQAADQVPLDAIVSQSAGFTTPLELAPLARWRALADDQVLPVRRTDATFASGGQTVTVPALGVPAGGLTRIHGWRQSDGSAPLAALARRLTPPGPVRVTGPTLPAASRSLSAQLSAPAIAVSVTADLRDRAGRIRQLTLGSAAARPRTVQATLPPGRWELEALELDEPPGLEASNGHQNAESPTGSPELATTVALGPLLARASSGVPLVTLPIAGWRAVGAATVIRSVRDRTFLRFASTGFPGILRPLQPSDVRPVPVLVDPQTAAAATRGGLLALTVDGLPVSARVVGVLARFPTLAPGGAGFVVADEAVLASALDARFPGQGRPDELWIATRDPRRLRSALAREPLSQLGVIFRSDIAHQLRNAPIARGVLVTLVAATAVTGALAVLGLLVALLGGARDRGVERDLAAQGVGPCDLRRELRLRLLIAGVLGVLAGLGFGILTARLAVATVRAAGTVEVPRPPLVTALPLVELVLWGLVATLALTAACLLATRRPARGGAT